MAIISVVSTIATLLSVLASVASSAAEPLIGLRGCQTTCGGVDVPYPFGIGAGCYYHKGFNLTCDITKGDPRLLLGDGATNLLQVSEISISRAIVRITHAGDIKVDGDGHGAFLSGLAGDGPYTLSAERNELVVTGCNVVATLRDTTSNLTVGSCSSSCPGEFVGMLPGSSSRICGIDGETITPLYRSLFTRKQCSGMLCCQAPLTAVHKVVAGKSVSRMSYDVQLTWFGQNVTEDEQMPRLRVFVAEVGWFDRFGGEWIHMAVGYPTKAAMDVPVVLDWEVLGWRHGAVGKNSSKEDCPVYAARSICKSKHSNCVAGYKGYLCKCKDGFDGSPYVTDGCQDINECELLDLDKVCFGECTNTYGSFQCRCPRGTVGDPSKSVGCFKAVNAGLVVGLSVAFSTSLILLFIGTVLIRHKIRIHGARRLRKKFFIQNRGQLLKQLVSHRSGIADRMIISLEEIHKATNNFDPTRKLGDGGHGIVYKGILSDLHVVAIKRSKIMIQKEIDDFINEVAILSHINHRNIVKLYGCCLETQVPMLAFEFISNGTLSDHLHRESPRSIPWEHRLRIASEVGKAISYLHFSVSSPIIHRDIKSSNILLDDAFTAKVSDFGTSRYIPISQTGIIPTAIQGTIGYLDPMYYYTGRMSEKSDVYSFGVLLVELLTRNTPIKYSSSEGEGLLVKFVELLAKGNLVEILDSQVVEEGGNEVEEVAVLAATCIRLSGDERPTMRQVEVALESIRSNKQRVLHFGAERNDESYIATSYPPIGGSTSLEELSRQHSQEKEFYLSARYPR